MLSLILDPSRYVFSPLALQTAFTALTAFCLGVFMLGRELDRRMRTSFFLLTTAVSWWLFAFACMYASSDPRTAIVWAKTAYLGIPFIPAADYTFSAAVLRDFDRSRMRIAAAWSVSALFCLQLLATDSALGDLHRYAWGFYPRFTPAAAPFTLYCVGTIVYVLVRLGRGARRTERGVKQAWPVPAAFAGGTLAAVDFLPAFGLPVYPAGYLLIFLFIILSVYLMAVRRFPDIIPGVVASRVIEIMQEALIVLDRSEIVRLCNRAACVLLGQEEGKLAGRRLSGNLMGNRFLAAEVAAAVRSGPVTDQRIDFPRQDGTMHAATLTVTTIRDWTGEPLFHVCVLHDITERLLTEWALEESNAGLSRQLNFTRTLLRTEPVAVFVKDAEGRYLECNEEFSKIVGVPVEDIRGKTVFDLWPREMAERYHAQDMAMLRNPERQRYEFTVPAAQGDALDVLFTKDVLIDEKGAVRGIIGTFIDITERKRAEAEIRSLNDDLERRVRERTAEFERVNAALQAEVQERLRTEEDLRTNRIFLGNILNSIQDPIVVLDRDRAILLANRTFEAVFGAGRERDYAGRPCHEVLFGWSDPCGTCLSEQSSRTGLVTHKSVTVPGEGGAARWFDVSAFPLFATDGRVVGNVHQLREITERKKAEETIAKNREQLRSLSRQLLASEERERRRIAREVHDEMGQVLTGIKLNLQEVQRGAAADVAEKIERVQGDIGDLMVRMRDLSARLRPAMLDDLGLVPALQWHGERIARQTGMRVDLEHQCREGELPHEVSLTLFRIAQEALTNAVRHSGADRVHIAVRTDAGTASITVRDAGSGFDPEEALGRGTTLGLVGMRERVEMAGGELLIRSRPNEGTEIECRLPVGPQRDGGEGKV